MTTERDVLTANCTPDCKITERWIGATLYSQRVTHRHGPAVWGKYNAQILGMDCRHVNVSSCAGLRNRDELTRAVMES